MLGQLVADEHHLAAPSCFVQRPGDAPIAGADIVDAAQPRAGGEQASGLVVAVLEIVADLAQLDDAQSREIVREDMAKSHLPLLVAAVAERAREQRHLAHGAGDEASEQVAGEAAGIAVVDADIGDARRLRDVGHQGEDGRAGGRDLEDRLAHQGMVDGDDPDAASGPRMLAQAGGQRLGAEAVDAMDANVHFRTASGADGQQMRCQQIHEGVRTALQDEVQAHGPSGGTWLEIRAGSRSRVPLRARGHGSVRVPRAARSAPGRP